MVSKGTLELRRKLAKRGDKQALATSLDVSLPMVSKWLSGDVGPDPKNRAKIQDLHGIDWRSWDEPAAEEEPNGSAA